jgi:hypothetical protein
VDVVVSAGPSLDQVRKEKVEAYQALIQMPAPMRRGFAKFAGIDPEIVRQIDEDERTIAEQQGLAGGGGVVRPTVPGAALGPAAPAAPPSQPAVAGGMTNGGGNV